MKIALECPTNLLGTISPLADFDWALCHLVLKDEEYANYFRNSNRTVVLDNSVNELLAPCSLSDMREAANIIYPDFIVPPDWLGDWEQTYDSVRTAKGYFSNNIRLIPVIQGSSLEDCMHLADKYYSMGYKLIAVPYDILCSRNSTLREMEDSRVEVITTLGEWDFKIHLLGMTTLDEFYFYYYTVGKIWSIDTGIPVKEGLLGNVFGIDRLPDKREPTMNLMGHNSSLDKVFYNIAYLRRVIGEGYGPR